MRKTGKNIDFRETNLLNTCEKFKSSSEKLNCKNTEYIQLYWKERKNELKYPYSHIVREKTEINVNDLIVRGNFKNTEIHFRTISSTHRSISASILFSLAPETNFAIFGLFPQMRLSTNFLVHSLTSHWLWAVNRAVRCILLKFWILKRK